MSLLLEVLLTIFTNVNDSLSYIYIGNVFKAITKVTMTCDSHYICAILLALATLGGATQIGSFLFSVAPPKVAKASSAVTVTYRNFFICLCCCVSLLLKVFAKNLFHCKGSIRLIYIDDVFKAITLVTMTCDSHYVYAIVLALAILGGATEIG